MNKDVLRYLARARAAFQLRAIATIIRGPAQAGEAGTAETGTGSVHEHAVRKDAPNK